MCALLNENILLPISTELGEYVARKQIGYEEKYFSYLLIFSIVGKA